MTTAPIRRDGRRAPLDKGRLRRLRMEAGMSQRKLAEVSGLSTSLISALECGDSGASPETVATLAEHLGCSTGDLMLEAS